MNNKPLHHIYTDTPGNLDNLTVGLIGDKLTHSHSPTIHKILGNPHYKLYELTNEQLPDFIKSQDYHALNVTIPYKKDVIPFCDSVSPTAKLCESVNTICRRDGKLYGYNTDFVGLITLFKFYDIDVLGKNCVVLGSGGAGSTAVRVLEHLGAKKVITVSRSGNYNYQNVTSLTDTEILVNATPVGLFGRNNNIPVEPEIFPKLESVVDLIANPYRTELMNRAQRLGIKAVGGDAMLVAQAVAGFALFFDLPARFSEFGRAYADYRRYGSNIILIGMPGSGKTTVGRLVAQQLGMKLIDADTVLEQREGVPIPTIFEKKGERYFRELETAIINELCEENGCVISTGGGVIENPDNISRLRRSGMVFQVTRELSELSLAGRPVSQRDGIEALFKRRKPLYDACCDFEVNNKTPQQRCDVIIEKFYTDCINNKVDLDGCAELV